MKSVVIEIRGNVATLLSDNGCIINVKNKNYEIGQEVINSMKNKSKMITAIAAAACFVVVLTAGVAAYNVPTSYVSFDVNPSIEYEVNMFGKVVSVNGVNDDGSELIAEIELDKLKNKSIDDALSLTVDKVTEAGYLNEEGSGIVIATSAKNMKKAGELAEKLEEVANDACEKNNRERVAQAEAVGKERVEEARELGVTPGKLNIVQKLRDSSEDPGNFNIDEWLDKSVKDIMAQTNKNKGQQSKQEKNAGEETQNQEQNKNSGKNPTGSNIADTTGKGKSGVSETIGSDIAVTTGKGKFGGSETTVPETTPETTNG